MAGWRSAGLVSARQHPLRSPSVNITSRLPIVDGIVKCVAAFARKCLLSDCELVSFVSFWLDGCHLLSLAMCTSVSLGVSRQWRI